MDLPFFVRSPGAEKIVVLLGPNSRFDFAGNDEFRATIDSEKHELESVLEVSGERRFLGHGNRDGPFHPLLYERGFPSKKGREPAGMS